MSTTTRLPQYRLHKPSGLAVVRLNGRDLYLGKHGTPESRDEYQRLVAEWLAGHRQPTSQPGPHDTARQEATINELFVAYWAFVKSYYLKNGSPTREQRNILDACGPAVALYGRTRVVDFGPRSLKAVRQKMIESRLCRGVINSRINRIRRMFKWGVENELVSPSILQGLQAVAALKRGRSEARESDRVKPVPEAYVDAVLAFVQRPVRAMIELQRLTGMRSGEVTAMRTCDLDMSAQLWTYRPASHKTEHHCQERIVYLGPRAQEIVKPFLSVDTAAYLFTPARAEAERRAERFAARKTPLSCGNRPGTNKKSKPNKLPGMRYSTETYGRAVRYGCERAFLPPDDLKRKSGETQRQWIGRLTEGELKELQRWQKTYFWHPHQLRHNAATRLRKEFGIEAARVVLGHRSSAVTEIYAEVDHLRAAEVMARVG